MKRFAALCVLVAAGLAFEIQSIESLEFDSSFDDIDSHDKPKKKVKKTKTSIPQIPSYDDEAEAIINELVEDQKACVESAKDCKIDPDEDSRAAQFGLGELLDGVAEGFDKLVQQNAATEKQAIDAIGEQTNKTIDAQIAAATANATSQLVTDVADVGEIDLIKNASKLADGAEAAKEAS